MPPHLYRPLQRYISYCVLTRLLPSKVCARELCLMNALVSQQQDFLVEREPAGIAHAWKQAAGIGTVDTVHAAQYRRGGGSNRGLACKDPTQHDLRMMCSDLQQEHVTFPVGHQGRS